MPGGTENIGVFLAIVHALAYLQQQQLTIPIYSNNAIALQWFKMRNIRTPLKRNAQNTEIFELLDRAIAWLRNNSYNNRLLLWQTQLLGTIPADFSYSPPVIQQLAQPASSPSPPKIISPEAAEKITDEDIITVTISGRTYKLKEQVKQVGMVWKNKQWTGQFPHSKMEILKDFCLRYNLSYKIEGNNIKESRLARGQRPISGPSTPAVMGEGAMQWAIEETMAIESQRRHRQKKKRKK